MTGLGGEESPSRTYRYTWLQCPSVLAKAWVRALPPRCRGTGVLFRVIGPPPEYTATWRIAQYNLQLAIPNHAALEAAALAGRGELRGTGKAE